MVNTTRNPFMADVQNDQDEETRHLPYEPDFDDEPEEGAPAAKPTPTPGHQTRARGAARNLPGASSGSSSPGSSSPSLPPLPGLSSSSEEFSLDLTGIELGGLITDPGAYYMFCENVETGFSQAGNPKYIFSFRVIQHPEFAGRKFQLHCALTSAALWKIKQTLDAFGIDTSGQTRFSRDELINRVVIGQVVEDEWDNKVRSNLDRVERVPDENGGPNMTWENGRLVKH